MLGSLIADLQDRKHLCTVYRCSESPEIEQWLATHGIAIESRPLPPDGPDPFIELKADDEVKGIIGIEAVEGITEPPIVRPGARDDISEGYRVLFDILAKTVVSGMSRREFLAVSREIEDRAYRVGEGTLRVCFQTFSTFKSQIAVYRTLAADTDLEIHIYGVDDWTPPALTGVNYHPHEAERFGHYWAMAYDGGPDCAQACGLVAEELPDGYTGFWTNELSVVEDIARTLNAV